jgi:hypothetical protein
VSLQNPHHWAVISNLKLKDNTSLTECKLAAEKKLAELQVALLKIPAIRVNRRARMEGRIELLRMYVAGFNKIQSLDVL